jgi:hypothetical protein
MQCSYWYDRGNRYRPTEVVKCRRAAVEVVEEKPACAQHAKILRRNLEANVAARELLREFEIES